MLQFISTEDMLAELATKTNKLTLDHNPITQESTVVTDKGTYKAHITELDVESYVVKRAYGYLLTNKLAITKAYKELFEETALC